MLKETKSRQIVVTIDGPAGAGKTTVSRILAERLGYKYIDTGALYRGVALSVKESGIDPENEEALSTLCRKLDLKFEKSDVGLRLLIDGKDVSDSIRTPEIAMLASAVSAKPVVRHFLLDVQRRMGKEKGTVFEGRDMGTVVFPEAEIKFFLDASLSQRAHRRYRELAKDPSITMQQVEADMRRRDHNDSTRDLAPLKPANDATIIDSSQIPADKVVEKMFSLIETRLKSAITTEEDK